MSHVTVAPQNMPRIKATAPGPPSCILRRLLLGAPAPRRRPCRVLAYLVAGFSGMNFCLSHPGLHVREAINHLLPSQRRHATVSGIVRLGLVVSQLLDVQRG